MQKQGGSSKKRKVGMRHDDSAARREALPMREKAARALGH